MKHLRKRSFKTVGQPPGTLVYTGDKISEETKIQIIEYDEQHYSRKEVKTVDECYPCKTSQMLSWINVSGLGDLEIVEAMGKHFEINSLVMEDILNMTSVPSLRITVTICLLL